MRTIERVIHTTLSFEALSRAAFFLYLFFIFFGVGLPFQEKAGDAEELTTSNPFRQIVFSLIYFIAFISLIPEWNRLFKIIKNEKFLTFFILWAIVSILWSNHPAITFKRWLQVFGTFIVFASVFVHLIHTSNFLKHFRTILYLYILVTIVSILLVPEASQSYQGELAWRGIAHHKNQLGQIALISCIVWFFSLRESEKRIEYTYLFMLLLSLILLIGTKSTTSGITLIILVILFMVTSIRQNLERKTVLKWFLISLLLSCIVILLSTIILFPQVLGSFFAIVGKDPTFTGRTDLWKDVVDLVGNRIFFGSGYGAFWIFDSKQILFLYSIYIWLPQQAHNGYVDVTLETGLVGLLLLITMIIMYFVRNRKLYARNQFLTYFVYATIVINFQESSFFRTTSMLGVLFIFSYLYQAASLYLDYET